MSEIHETIEKAQEGEHSQYFNRRIALLIAAKARRPRRSTPT
jgi:hypothetical protein